MDATAMRLFGHLHLLIVWLFPILCAYIVWILNRRNVFGLQMMFLGLGIFHLIYAIDVVIQMLGLMHWENYGPLWFIFVLGDDLCFCGALYFMLRLTNRIK